VLEFLYSRQMRPKEAAWRAIQATRHCSAPRPAVRDGGPFIEGLKPVNLLRFAFPRARPEEEVW